MSVRIAIRNSSTRAPMSPASESSSRHGASPRQSVESICTLTIIRLPDMKSSICVIMLALLTACAPAISKRDIRNLEGEITRDCEAKQYTVTEIHLTKQSETALAGYVRMKRNVPGVGDMVFTKVCSASMDASTKRWQWACK